MTVLEARDSEGQVIYGASMDELAERTRNAGTEYTSWTVYDVAHTAAGTEPEKTYLGYMIDRQFISLDKIDAERDADHEPDLDELLADPEVAAEADRIVAGGARDDPRDPVRPVEARNRARGIITMITSRPAAVAMASAAIGVSGQSDLRAVPEAIGFIQPVPQMKPTRMVRAWRSGRYLQPLHEHEVSCRATGTHGPCPVPCCDRPAPAHGTPCERCMADLAGYIRPVSVRSEPEAA